MKTLYFASDLKGMDRLADFVPFIFWIVVAIAAITVIMSVFSMLKNTKDAKKFLFGAIGLIALFGLMWVLAGDAAPMNGATGKAYDVTSKSMKVINAFIGTTLVMIVAATLFFIFDTIKGLFNI